MSDTLQLLLSRLPGYFQDSEQSVSRDSALNPYTDHQLVEGVVIDCWAGLHLYLVRTALRVPVLATELVDTGVSSLGAVRDAMFPVGTRVLLCRTHMSQPHLLLGAIPAQVGDHLLNRPISLTGEDIDQEGPHRLALKLASAKEMFNFNATRPMDTLPGDWGVFNSLGAGFHLGAAVATLRASELAALEFFYYDHLARLMAHNLRITTAVREEWSGDDDGEHGDLVRHAHFPWEAKGFLFPDGAFAVDRAEKKVTPPPDDQRPIYRLHQWRGFLGDAERVIVTAPGPGHPDTASTTKPGHTLALSETTRHANGLLEFRSLKGVYLSKEAWIPFPEQIHEPDDPQGDTPENYKASGTTGTGKEHDKSELALPLEQLVLSTLEHLAHVHNHYGLDALRKHEKDWHIEPSTEPLDRLPFGPSADLIHADLPQPYQLDIDVRPGHSHRFYRSRAFFGLMEDGSVVLEDAWGSQVIMSRGVIKITAPLDVRILPGRDLTVMAPNDVVLRAGGDADLTAGQGSVRVKAQENFHVLAGNDRDAAGKTISPRGGILLESRSSQGQDFSAAGEAAHSAGVIIRSAGQVTTYARNIYLESDNGITLDAHDGKGDVHVYCHDLLTTHDTNGEAITLYGTNPRTRPRPSAVEVHSASEVMFGQRGSFTVWAGTSLLPNGSLTVKGAVIARDMGTRSGELGQWRSDTAKSIDDAVAVSTNALAAASAMQAAPVASERSHAPDGPGTEQVRDEVGFSLRVDAEYGPALVLDEARWQQYRREFGLDGDVWAEPEVWNAKDQVTMPYPGVAAWRSDSGFITQGACQHWDATTGLDNPQPPDSNTVSQPVKGGMDKKYLVPK